MYLKLFYGILLKPIETTKGAGATPDVFLFKCYKSKGLWAALECGDPSPGSGQPVGGVSRQDVASLRSANNVPQATAAI
jgi:hypothetical protein